MPGGVRGKDGGPFHPRNAWASLAAEASGVRGGGLAARPQGPLLGERQGPPPPQAANWGDEAALPEGGVRQSPAPRPTASPPGRAVGSPPPAPALGWSRQRAGPRSQPPRRRPLLPPHRPGGRGRRRDDALSPASEAATSSASLPRTGSPSQISSFFNGLSLQTSQRPRNPEPGGGKNTGGTGSGPGSRPGRVLHFTATHGKRSRTSLS